MKRIKNFTPSTRRKLYRIMQAALVLAAAYGFIDGELLALWLVLAAAVLDVAVANVPEEVKE